MTIDFVANNAADVSEIQILGGSKVNYGTNAKLSCPMGNRLQYNLSVVNTSVDGWRIDCNKYTRNSSGALVFNNPSCEKLLSMQDDDDDDDSSARPEDLNSKCVGLPLDPVVLYTTGTVACSPCPNNQYTLHGGSKSGQNPAEASLSVAMVSLSFLLFHVLQQPYRAAWVNQLQLCANVCLVLICMLQELHSTLASAVFVVKGSPLADLNHRVNVCMLLLLFPTPLFLAYGKLFVSKNSADADSDADDKTMVYYDSFTINRNNQDGFDSIILRDENRKDEDEEEEKEKEKEKEKEEEAEVEEEEREGEEEEGE
eukprot:g1535.t1